MGLESLECRLYRHFPGWLELPLTGINFHGPKPVHIIEVLLYKFEFGVEYTSDSSLAPDSFLHLHEVHIT